jgi:NAD(P)-dependent dehydrogenase (short-subunit alcohol dehydrogenase family)
MVGRLEGKIAVITGACSGIGLGTVELFAAEGAHVVAADIQDEKGAILEQRFPGRVVYARCDVTDEAQIAAAIAKADAAFGGLDILFNNAGAGGSMAAADEIDAAGWDMTFALLVRAPALGTKHAIPLMRKRGGGTIVNTASIAGLQAGWGPVAYSAAKAAVIQYTKAASADLARDNIRINAICPGLIATSIFGAGLNMPRAVADQFAARIEEIAPSFQPVKTAGLPKHIAEAALFLASDASAFITGTHLVVDGGLTIGSRHAWDEDSPSPFLSALGIDPEQAKALRAAAKAQAAANGG